MSDDLVTIASFVNCTEADMARGLLESCGIEVFLSGGNVARMGINLAAITGGAKLQVRREDEAAACEILGSCSV